MYRIYLVLVIALALGQVKTNAQGCVAIKGTSGICSRPSDAKGWELTLITGISNPINIL